MNPNNTVVLIGRLVRDPDVRYSQSANGSMAIASFTLAVDRNDKDHNADFITCKAFGKRGEFVEKYVKKGTKVVVKGSWTSGSYTDKNGNKVYTNECNAEDLTFAESKSASSGSDTPTPSLKDELPQMSSKSNVPTGVSTDKDGFMVVNDDFGDLPFANVR